MNTIITMGLTPDNIKDFLIKAIDDKPAIVGISGGIDSALVLMILSKSIGKEKIHAYFIPDSYTPKSDFEDVKALEKSSGIPIKVLNIENTIKSFRELLPGGKRENFGNLKSRVRMSILYYFSNSMNGIVVGTTNYSEYVTGYYTKYGDGGCDIEPIISLTKSEVRKMAFEAGVPEAIIRKTPTAGLWEGQTDEEDLGFKYAEIDDAITHFKNHGMFPETPAGRRVMELYNNSNHKRKMPVSLED